MAWLQRNFPVLATLSVMVLLFAVSCVLPNSATGDSGDSVLHYLYSHYAPKHPELFFDHWAKPLFVMLSATFASFGFNGLVAFNIICAALTSLFTYYTVRKLN